jgi:hypothetical protein
MALETKGITHELRSTRITIGARLRSKVHSYARSAVKRVLYVVRYAYHSVRTRVTDLHLGSL